jgi:hypothetical protein
MSHPQHPQGQPPWPPAAQPQSGPPAPTMPHQAPGFAPGYPPVGPGYPPPGLSPSPPAKKSNVGLIIGIIAAVVVVLCGGGVLVVVLAGGNGASTPSQRKHAGLNESVRDGSFEFTVKSVTCGKDTVGETDGLNKTAQGQFCEVSLTVKNIKNEPQTFDGSFQKAIGTNGATYGNDGEAEIYANSENQTFLNKINPGNSTEGLLVFDIPKDAKIASLELHDSPFSGGVIVDVN